MLPNYNEIENNETEMPYVLMFYPIIKKANQLDPTWSRKSCQKMEKKYNHVTILGFARRNVERIISKK